VVGIGLLAYRYGLLRSPEPDEVRRVPHPRALPKEAKGRIHLYFGDPEHDLLAAEVRTLAFPDSLVERARVIIDALIEGPKGPLTQTVPPETKILAVYLAEGVIYVDFDQAITDNHPGGTLSELLAIYSLVNTLCLNMPDIEAVKILIAGREAKTLAGHIDIRFPIRPNMLMVASQRSSTR
jgi:spore germination protein GerM